MKKIIVSLVMLGFLCSGGVVMADSITLNSGQMLSVPTAAKISEWQIILIDAAAQRMQIRYRWRDADYNLLTVAGNRTGWEYWECRNRSEGNNADCTDVDTPWDCCTGAETGTCPEMLDTCFSDVFGFQIRQQDVGTSIGIGLRTLIWNQMKQDILTGGNDGSFD